MSNLTGKRIQYAINLRNMKQVDVINKTGINKGALSSYISGRYKPKDDSIYKLALVLEVNPEWLRGKDVPMELDISSYYYMNTFDDNFIINNKIEILAKLLRNNNIIDENDIITDEDYDRVMKLIKDNIDKYDNFYYNSKNNVYSDNIILNDNEEK